MDRDQYYNWQAIRELLGMRDLMLYNPPEMIYMDSLSQNAQQRRQQNSNSWQDLLKNSGSVSTGMTPNAVNAYGEPFYGWGAQTGDWGAGASVPFDGSQYATSLAEIPSETGGVASSGYGYIFPILAAIAGQHIMSSNTDRQTDGHRTGDVFSGDFFTEPWMAYAQEKFGADAPTAGEETDAAIDRIQDGRGGFSDLASTVPSTAYQWFDPVGDFAGNLMSDRFGNWGKAATTAVLPHTGLKWLADFLGDLF